MNLAKITTSHTQRKAFVYLRQSTPGQVRFHQESTERQYRFKKRALELGWPENRIEVLDRDLGQSGKQTTDRKDFKKLVAEVSMGNAGAVFALEASRLSRSCADWHRLLELCALTASLIVDEDGVYNPTDFNDQLLLGLKGTMSQAELHFMRARLWGGKLNKAQKGELRFPLPVGFCYDPDGQTVFDPDREVQGVVQLLFDWFRETQSAYGVVHRFAKENVPFPKRAYGGAWNGKLLWSPLEYGRVLSILKNPSYAGCYTFGRFGSRKTVSSDGTVETKTIVKPEESWYVCIRNHHKGYIGWEEFMENQTILQKNRTNVDRNQLPGPAREGHALLQGLLVCGKCGHRITIRYKGNGGVYAAYECNGRRRDGTSTTSCLSFKCDLIDDMIAQKALEFVQPARLEISLKALEELEKRRRALEQQWQMRIQRAQYEVDLAQRRYEQVDPANRLVASTLEAGWNDALNRLQTVQAEYKRALAEKLPDASPETRRQILELSRDLPRIWKSQKTQTKDRKKILRLILKDVTVEKVEPRQLLLHVRWQGGALEDLLVQLPPPVYEQVRCSKDVIAAIRFLAENTENDEEVAQQLNAQGHKSPKGLAFTKKIVQWLRYQYKISTPSSRRPGEMSVKETAEEFGVSPGVVYYWIKRKIVSVRKSNNGATCWISIAPQQQNELKTRAENAQQKSKSHLA